MLPLPPNQRKTVSIFQVRLGLVTGDGLGPVWRREWKGDPAGAGGGAGRRAGRTPCWASTWPPAGPAVGRRAGAARSPRCWPRYGATGATKSRTRSPRFILGHPVNHACASPAARSRPRSRPRAGGEAQLLPSLGEPKAPQACRINRPRCVPEREAPNLSHQVTPTDFKLLFQVGLKVRGSSY